MRTAKTHCVICGCPLQWRLDAGPYSGIERHYETVHPGLALDERHYEWRVADHG